MTRALARSVTAVKLGYFVLRAGLGDVGGAEVGAPGARIQSRRLEGACSLPLRRQ